MVKKKRPNYYRKSGLAWLNFSLTPTTYQKVKDRAKEEETSVAALVRRLLREYIAA